jgi:UDP-2,4-diacetamido-2,4,6-trideoxy-beta-L-altropyranose hydrolase
MVIDDLADRTHIADILLDQNFFGESTHQRYRGLLPPQSQQLLGPHYALLGPEYAQLHPLVPPRTELQRVLVFFGGVDPDNLTGRVLEALIDPALADLAVDVVLGFQSPHHKAVEDLVSIRPHTTLHAPLPSLAGLITRADLAIGAVGATTWERACLGLPSISIPFATNQIPVSQVLARNGYIRLIEFQPDTFTSKLVDEVGLFFDTEYIKNASLLCRSLVQGEGAKSCSDLLLRCSPHSSFANVPHE